MIVALLLACQPREDSDAPVPTGPAGMVVASATLGPEGGQLDLEDGSVLTVPAGALDADTDITVRYPASLAAIDPGMRVWAFEPDGLEFAGFATFRFPLPEGADDLLVDGAPTIQAWHVGSANGVTDLGSEHSLYAAVPVDIEGGHAVAALDHFSVFEATAEVDQIGYIVTDIPAKYLQYGDIYFTLTKMGMGIYQNEKDGPNWAPGHVAILAGVPGSPDRIIEATPPNVLTSTVTEFNSDPGHLTLGPHRPIPPLSGGDSVRARSWLEDRIGDDYNGVFGLGGINSYSCVGLAEKMLDEVDKGTVDWEDEVLGVMAPLYLHRRTRPVRAFRVVAGEYVQVPIHGVRVADESFAPSESPPWEYYCGCDYQMAFPSLPANAAVLPGTPRAGDGAELTTSYTFAWQTYPEDAGRTVDVPLEMSFELEIGAVRAPILLSDALTIEVVGPQGGTVSALVLAREIEVGGIVLPAGSVFTLDRVSGGTISGPDAGCPADHLHGGPVEFDGLGPFADPDPSGCGYGRIVDYPEELLE